MRSAPHSGQARAWRGITAPQFAHESGGGGRSGITRVEVLALGAREFLLDRLRAAKGTEEFRIGEIFLSATPESKPAVFENAKRMKVAEQGLAELSRHVDSLIVILNERLTDVLGEDIFKRLWESESQRTLRIQLPGATDTENLLAAALDAPESTPRRTVASRVTGISFWVTRAEIMAAEGFDFLVADMEHTPIDVPEMIGILRTIAGTVPAIACAACETWIR